MDDRFAQHAEWGKQFGDAIFRYVKERQLFPEGEQLDAAAAHLYRTWLFMPIPALTDEEMDLLDPTKGA